MIQLLIYEHRIEILNIEEFSSIRTKARCCFNIVRVQNKKAIESDIYVCK